MFTSVIVSTAEKQTIALFFTGRQHAGENLSDVLQQRAAELAPPMQMCDALSRNLPKLPEKLEVIVGHCLAHARRRFVEVIENFPQPCRHVLEQLGTVYGNDATARKQAMTAEERIHNEIVVDAYGPEEQALGWYYYLENKIKFPFSARRIAAKVVSPLCTGETVEVRRLAPEDSCAHDMLVLIRWHGRNVAVPLSQLVAVDADESTVEAIGDWHYWLGQGYSF